MSGKLSESLLRKLVGTRTPLPGGKQQLSPQMVPKAPDSPASGPAQPTANFRGLTNPKRVIEDRMAAAEKGMACGGKVRGSGRARKGHGKGAMR